jgi:NUMOD1 domain
LTIGNLNRGKKFSEETIEKMRQKALIRKNFILSEESYLNLKKPSKPLIVYNLDYTIFGTFYSLTEAALELKCSVKTIYRVLRTEKKILKRR